MFYSYEVSLTNKLIFISSLLKHLNKTLKLYISFQVPFTLLIIS
jgi:hypothetical protein